MRVGWKFNVDAAVLVERHKWGAGSVIRDQAGGFVAVAVVGAKGDMSVLDAEARGLILSLKLAKDLGLELSWLSQIPLISQVGEATKGAEFLFWFVM